jgi:hypothetical protein
MPDQNALVTVFRSAEQSAESEAAEVAALLSAEGIRTVVLGDDAPGVVEGSWEVRVPPEEQARAEKIVGTPRPEPEDEEEVPERGLSHDLDFVSVFSDQGAEAEMEAISIKALLEGSGIPAVLIGSMQFPSLPFEVRVPKSRLEEAQGLIADARQSGAAEGEG